MNSHQIFLLTPNDRSIPRLLIWSDNEMTARENARLELPAGRPGQSQIITIEDILFFNNPNNAGIRLLDADTDYNLISANSERVIIQFEGRQYELSWNQAEEVRS